MWPFSEMSLFTATLWSDIANLVFLVSLLMGVLSTFAIIRLANVKEHHWEEDRRQSAERISSNEKETKRAIAESDIAKKGAADANERAKLAELEIVRLKTPRSVSADQRLHIADKLKPLAKPSFAFAIMEEPEPLALMEEIASALNQAGWKRIPYALTSGGWTRGGGDTPAFGAIFSLTGLQIGYPATRKAEWGQIADALREALKAESGIEATAGAMDDVVASRNDAVVIFIGRKP